MGSRGNIYLFNDPEKCYIITRNGYKMKDKLIEKDVLHAEYKRLINRMFNDKSVYHYDKQPELFILDAEVLPWRTIGKGLIDQQFISVSLAIKNETETLTEHGFEDVLSDLNNNDEYIEYCEVRKTMKKEELTQKYGYTKERTFRSMYEYNHLHLEEELRYAENYATQVELYGGEGKFRIEPFSILKMVYTDGSEKLFDNESNIEIYSKITDQIYAIMDLDKIEKIDSIPNTAVNVYKNGNEHVGLWPLIMYYEYITVAKQMEGIVGKPEQVFVKGIAPYLKIRNEHYLTIVYGHNYMFKHKYDKLVTKKNVGKKLKASIKEFELGLKLLKIPYNKLAPDNQEYNKLMAEMIVEVDKEKQIDPRL